MQMSYNEEELLLRILLGLVFPFLLLVALRMTRLGLRRWENGWRGSAVRWVAEFSRRRGAEDPDRLARRTVSALLSAERLLAYFSLALLLALLWFVLFPQTRPLAQDLSRLIVAPAAAMGGKIFGAAALILYSAAVFAAAYWITRGLAGRRSLGRFERVPTNPLAARALKGAVWLFAAFLFLLPYPGLPRLFGLGAVLIAAFVAIVALRPVIEEISIGIHLCGTLGLRVGDDLKVGDRECRLLELRSSHALVLRDGERVFLPYSAIMKSETAVRPEAPSDVR